LKGEDMNKTDLTAELSKKKGLPIAIAGDVVNILFDGITNTLKKGGRVELRGFGSFKVKKYKGYKGRNPKTGESIKVKPKKLPFFKCGKELKERVATYKKGRRRKLGQKTEAMKKQLERAQAAKKANVKAAKKAMTKKPARVSASETLLAIIQRSKKGVDTAALRKKTGFEERKIWNVINSLKSRGKIKSGGRGIYVKA
jgi:integration host factor subunit beta